jgi:tRNA nucleotidyltransferase (CCA-adding enzyme)
VYIDDLGIKADIVPAFKIDNIEDMGTAVDRSPMHAEFINAHFTDKQRDDVRVMKYLLKSQGIYGAEVKTGGFSGYLCELLVYYYGSLLKLLDAAANDFKLPILLDPRNKVVINDMGLIKRFGSMFVVIDPVDKNRNVAAGVSMESLSRFVITARAFTSRPSIKIFYGKKFAPRKAAALLSKFLSESGLDISIISTQVPNKSEDVIWPQLRKVSAFIADHAERSGFRIYFSIPIISGDNGLIVFFSPKERITARMLKGPSAFMPKAQKEFAESHKNAIGMFLRDDVMYALEKSRYGTLRELMEEVVGGKLVKRHKDIKIIGSRLFMNKVPAEYAESVYAGLMDEMETCG